MSKQLQNMHLGVSQLLALILALALLALNFSASAQPAGLTTPIAFGQTVQGTLTSTDPIFQDGTPFDAYIFTVSAPGPFFIKVSSPNLPLFVTLYRVAGGQFIGLQDAGTYRAGQTLGMFGVLSQPGQYEIDISSFTAQQPTGSYTVSLTNSPPPAALSAQ